jgi:cytochrome P450
MERRALAPNVASTRVGAVGGADRRRERRTPSRLPKSTSPSSSSSRPNRRRPPVPPRLAATTADDALADLASLPAQAARLLSRSLEPPPPNFPPGPDGDAAVELGADPIKYIVDAQKKHGDVVGLRLAGERCVLVSDSIAAKDVLIDRSSSFVKEGTAFFPGSSLAGEGLLVSDGDVWARQRRLSNPAFRKAAVETYAASMVNAGDALLRTKWSTRQLRDVYADFNDLTLTIVADALFGADVRGARASQITNAIRDAFEFFGKRSSVGFIVPEWVPTPDNLAYNRAVAKLDKEVYKLITQRRARRLSEQKGGKETGDVPHSEAKKRAPRVVWDDAAEDWVDVDVEQKNAQRTAEASPASRDDDSDVRTNINSSASSDLLDRLLDAVDEEGDGGGMDDASLRDELMTLMVAGQETSAILLSWCCAFLAEHPSVASECAAEAERVLGSDGLDGSESPRAAAECYAELKYCEAVVYETMRLAPPAYMVGRCCAEDVTVGGYDLPKGTTVLVAPYLLHRDARKWERPLEFDPDRWLEKKTGGKAEYPLRGMGPNGAYVPFGAGPRVCIGTGFAMMEATLVLAMVARGVDLRLKPGAPPPKPRALITLRPEPFELDVVPRRRR